LVQVQTLAFGFRFRSAKSFLKSKTEVAHCDKRAEHRTIQHVKTTDTKVWNTV